MSGAFAAEEGCAIVPGVSEDAITRRAELAEIDDRIGAVAKPDSCNQALKQTEDYLGLKGNSYLVQYNTATKTLSVRTFSNSTRLSEQAFKDELLGNQPETVQIELDKVDDLRAAYPNYFLDVRMFTGRLQQIMQLNSPQSKSNQPSRWARIREILWGEMY